MTRIPPPERAAYPVHLALQTRWDDADRYGHMNNTVHYRLFDTAVNLWLIRAGLLDFGRADRIGLVVESGCRFHSEMTFPDEIMAGLRIGRMGASSVRWEVALFRNTAPVAAADGHFVHVYVNAASRRPEGLPQDWRDTLAPLVTQA